MNGRSQALRLPKEFRVTGEEVTLKRVAEGILIIERDPWQICREACAELSPDFLAAMRERVHPRAESRKWGGVFK